MPYTTVTLGGAITDLSARLADPSLVRWSTAELTLYLQFALRTFNTVANGHFRDTGVFDTTSGQAFYDLQTVIPALRGQTFAFSDLVTLVEYHLLEPPTDPWTGSKQFSIADIGNALSRRRDTFLLETGMVQTRTTQVITPVMGGRFPLSENVITIRRVAFQNTTGTVTPLHREDVWAFNHFKPTWVQNPGRAPLVPLGYSVGEVPPLTLQIAPAPSDQGTLDLVSINRGPQWSPTLSRQVGIPDDWTWVIVFGALADLLSKDGLASDPSRAQYCQQRWEQGLELAKRASIVWSARVNDVVVQVASLNDCDQFRVFWQGTTGRPTQMLTTGSDLVALRNVPDGIYGITVDVVRNAPVPVASGDYLQIGPELYDTILDYAESLALFKEGFDVIQSSMPLVERFYRTAGVSLNVDAASTPNRTALVDQSKQDERQTPRVEQTA